MAKYHLNPETGVPARCADPDSCGAGPHYDSRDEAFAAYELFVDAQATDQTPDPDTVTGEDYSRGHILVTALSTDLLKDGVATLSPGRYWIGDPAYVASTDEAAWQAWVRIAGETSHEFSDEISGAVYNQYPVVGVNTQYGDGYFEDQHGVGYSVDAGMIGAVPAELIEAMGVDKAKLDSLGSWLDSAEPLVLTRKKGTIHIGELAIATADGEDL